MSSHGNIGYIDEVGTGIGPRGPMGPPGVQGVAGTPGAPGQNATATNPITDALVVFASNATNPPSYKSASAPVTLGQPLAITVASDTTDTYPLVGQGTQSAASTKAVKLYVTNMAADSSSAAIAIGKLGTAAWEFYVDPTHTNEDKIVLKRMNGGATAMSVNSTDLLVTAPIGFGSTRYDVTRAATTPGGTTTLWADTNGIVRYDADRLLATSSVPTSDAIPVCSDALGHTSTAASATSATLSRPLSVATSVTTPVAVTSSNTLCVLAIGSTSAVTNRGAVSFGRPGFNKVWEVGSDSAGNNTDDLYIFSQTRANRVQEWTPTSSTMRVPMTVVGTTTTTGVPLTTSAANPGGTTTIWCNSASSSRPWWGAADQLALYSDIPANVASYSDGSNIFSWNVAAANGTLSVCKVRYNVTAVLAGQTDPLFHSTTAIGTTAVLAGYRPSIDLVVPMVVIDNGASVPGKMVIASTGNITISPINGSFSATGTVGWARQSVAWNCV